MVKCGFAKNNLSLIFLLGKKRRKKTLNRKILRNSRNSKNNKKSSLKRKERKNRKRLKRRLRKRNNRSNKWMSNNTKSKRRRILWMNFHLLHLVLTIGRESLLIHKILRKQSNSFGANLIQTDGQFGSHTTSDTRAKEKLDI
jgi:hypothetical protein